MSHTALFPATKVTVIRQLPHGLLVHASNGQMGIVRMRELAWTQLDDWKQDYPIQYLHHTNELKR